MPLTDQIDAFPDGPDAEFERRLPGALSGAAAAFPPHSPDLVSRAADRGRRLRRMRAVQVGAGATLALAAAVSGALVGTNALGAHGGSPQPVGPASSHGSSLAPDPSEPSVPSVSAQDMMRTLESVLPRGGSVSNASGRGTEPGQEQASPTAQLTYTDAQGSTSAVDIRISRMDPSIPADQQIESCLPVEVRPYDTCTSTRLRDGSTLYTTKSFTYPSSNSGQRRWYVELVTAGGARLDLDEFGGGGEKGTTSGVDPVLSTGQLASIVENSAWAPVINAIPVPAPLPDTSSGPQQTLSGPRMSSVLTSLLPKGGTVSDVSASADLIQLVYDDGHGKNMIEVDVQDNMTKALTPIMGCASPGSTSCQSLTLADGTKVKLTKQPSETGGSAVVWIVDTLHADGRRVAVRECNSYAESGPVTRALPALSMAQLQAIALNLQWLR